MICRWMEKLKCSAYGSLLPGRYPGELVIGRKTDQSTFLMAGDPGTGRTNGNRWVCELPSARVRKG